ncbi:CysZ protein [Rhodobium orientis]|uniref:Cysteine biosynthesis protein CysZ n=1 Tax=Rhodobium orientis TaxID=34017 RepID=A0A327JVG5_9HYPH|nr:sulfate transporter family protein [Rhodobium orientis]MBB4302025.1 CysZ protein [Rhodobium orientis]MBK5950262.1 cysteine biosynthesis protein CysZ [Rhodobium orientis]RAI27188.1 cysteine biosynthesis protein CysZ [Rhodobium orientis]
MLSDAIDAFRDVFTPPFRGVLWKSLGLTLALLVVLFIGAEAALGFFVDLSIPYVETIIGIVAGLGLVVGLSFLIAPVASIFAGLFLDEVAEVVEETRFPGDPPGRAMPILQGVWMALKFTGVVIAVNLLVLLLLLLPGINIVAFFIANGYLLGREYFEFAARRFRSEAETKRLRKDNTGQIFVAGLIIAALMAVPILNLVTPLFAAAFMVRLHKRMPAPALASDRVRMMP